MGLVRVWEVQMANAHPTLTKEQLETLHRKLEAERRKIVNVLQALPTPPTGPSEDERIEYEEAAQRTTEEEIQLDLTQRERALLAEVERALAKLHAGTYGFDEKTGEPIPYERLAAVPWAREIGDR
jgi:DnaK suppressor protein